MNVLLVSGDLMLMSAADGIVRRRGGAVTTAATPDEAVEKCRALRPELVLLDLRMPGLDPIALVPQLRAAAGGSTFILAAGPHVQEAALAAAAAAGCDEVATRGQFELRLAAALLRA